MSCSDDKNIYFHLNQLSNEQLEEIIRSDFNGEGLQDDILILAALEVLKKRANAAGLLPDLEQAWSCFMENYNTEDMLDSSLYSGPTYFVQTQKSRHKKILRFIISFVATLSLLFGGALAAQAAGFDVFTSLAAWTNEIFNFTSSRNHEILENALNEANLPGDYTPTWFPSGFYPDEAEVLQDKDYTYFSITFWSDDYSFTYNLDWYANVNEADNVLIEKTSKSGETKIYSDTTFYIMSNNDEVCAAWQKNNYIGFIGGDITYKELLKMLTSI